MTAAAFATSLIAKNAEEAIYKFREKLMEYPDIYVPIKRIPRFGSWEETELFYIPDIAFMANVSTQIGRASCRERV